MFPQNGRMDSYHRHTVWNSRFPFPTLTHRRNRQLYRFCAWKKKKRAQIVGRLQACDHFCDSNPEKNMSCPITLVHLCPASDGVLFSLLSLVQHWHQMLFISLVLTVTSTPSLKANVGAEAKWSGSFMRLLLGFHLNRLMHIWAQVNIVTADILISMPGCWRGLHYVKGAGGGTVQTVMAGKHHKWVTGTLSGDISDVMYKNSPKRTKRWSSQRWWHFRTF